MSMELRGQAGLDQDRWASHLDDGERLVWTGAPSGGIRLRWWDLMLMPFGLLFLLVGLGAVIGAGILFALPHALAGGYVAFGRHIVDQRARSRTRFALTDRRALATSGGGRFRSWPLGAQTPVEFIDKDNGSVVFEQGPRWPGMDAMWPMPPRGFEYIPDAREVFKLVRGVQAAAQKGAAA